MKQVPVNQEHKEAEQAALDKERAEFIATLTTEEQAQFKAVDKAVNILVKAKIPFYLFPMLPSFNFKGKQQVWQWNSLGASINYGKDGKPDEESSAKNSMYHQALFAFLFNQFNGFFNGDTMEKKLDSVPYFFYYCLTRHRDYLEDKEESEEKEK